MTSPQPPDMPEADPPAWVLVYYTAGASDSDVKRAEFTGPDALELGALAYLRRGFHVRYGYGAQGWLAAHPDYADRVCISCGSVYGAAHGERCVTRTGTLGGDTEPGAEPARSPVPAVPWA